MKAMRWRQLFRSIDQHLPVIFRWIGYISGAGVVVGWILKLLEWGNTGPFAYLKDNIQTLWLSAVTFIALSLLFWTSRLHQRFVSGFSDNFRRDLQDNWDFEGPWRITNKTLLVKGSNAGIGGITKVGAQWENYTFTLEAKIINQCLGVIVRAQDLSNYYMFQIWADRIRPHRRATVPVVETETSSSYGGKQQLTPVKSITIWQADPPTPLTRPLINWFKVKVTVRGQSVFLYINEDLVFQKDSFLDIPTGKVGFRNWNSEEAHVRNVKVTLQS
jgi:hypothetical protein